MKILITQWALDSYLDLLGDKVFSREEYYYFIRPDVMRLKNYPDDAKFRNGKFWSLAKDMNSVHIPSGFKMKWHQVGDGCVQLRLTVVIIGAKCFLCEAYVKKNDKVDIRKQTKFKAYSELIKQGKYVIKGELT